ncbi:hypothetical protein AAHE18_05G224100 [Arachis hypogaea]
MPMIGLGTSVTPLPPHQTLIQIFIDAFEAGYTHFDTAFLYGTEEPLGIALAKALELGIVNSRHEAFITSKLWCNNAYHDLVLPALKTTLKKLGLDYLDLYLIHMPVRLKPEVDGVLEIRKENLLPFDMKGTWEAMEECQRLGLARSIGVSGNEPIMATRKLIEFCKQKRIHLAAWSPLGSYTKLWGTNSVMESPIINEITISKHKSVPQVALKWILEQGAIPIVKSFNKERMRENLEIFEWELSQEESQKFSQIPQRRMFSGEIFVSENGPYKSLEEFWDAES